MNRLGLGLIFTARDLATPTMRRIRGSFSKMAGASDAAALRVTRAFKMIGGGAALAAAGFVGLGVMKKLSDQAGEFEFRLAGVKAIMSATTEELNLLENAAIGAGLATQFAPTEAVDGLRQLAQAGYKATEATTALLPVLDLAAASLGQLGVEQAAGLAVSGLKAFQKNAEDARYVVDKLVQSTTMSNLQFKDLPLAIGISARGVTILNATLDDTLISLGLIRNIIPTVERGATALAATMERLALPATMKRLKDELGVDVEAAGSFRPFLDIVGEISGKLRDMAPVQRAVFVQTTFQKRAMGGLVVILRQLNKQARDFGGGTEGMTKAIAALREEMGKSSGAAERFRLELLDTLKGQQILLRGTMQTLGVLFGKPFAELFKPMLQVFTDPERGFLVLFAQFFNKIPMGVKRVTAAFMMFGSIAAVVVGLIVVLTGALTLLGPVLVSALIPAIPVIAAVLVGLVAIAGAAAMVMAAWQTNFMGFRDFVNAMFAKFALTFNALTEVFTMGGFSKDVSDELNKAENSGIKGFVIALFMLGHRLKALFEGVATSLDPVMEKINKFAIPVVDDLGASVSGLTREVANLFAQLGLVDPVLAQSSSDWEKFGLILGVTVGNVLKGTAILIGWLVGNLTQTVAVLKAVIQSTRLLGAIFTQIDWGAISNRIQNAFITAGAAVKLFFFEIMVAWQKTIARLLNVFRPALAEIITLARKGLELLPSILVSKRSIDDLRDMESDLRKPFSAESLFGQAGPSPKDTLKEDLLPERPIIRDVSPILDVLQGRDTVGRLEQLGRPRSPGDDESVNAAMTALAQGALTGPATFQKILLQVDGQTLAAVIVKAQQNTDAQKGKLKR